MADKHFTLKKFKDGKRFTERRGQTNKVLNSKSAINEIKRELEWLQLREYVLKSDKELSKQVEDDILTERRRYVRVKCIQKVVCSKLFNKKDPDYPIILDSPINLTLFDISIGGVGAVCESDIDIDTIMYFDFVLDMQPYKVKAKVVYCFPVDGLYRLGFRFVDAGKQLSNHIKKYVTRLSLYMLWGDRN